MSKDKNSNFISRADIILAIAVLVIAGLLLLYFKVRARDGLSVTISIDGKVTKTLSIDLDTAYMVQTDAGSNKVVIEDGQVYVSEADCPDKICVQYKPISKVGETIICLPHKLVVEVTE